MTSSQINIVVEGQTDAYILRALLGTERKTRFRFWASQGRSSVATIARNIIAHEGAPVLIVIDTDTLDTRLSLQIQEETSAAAGGVGLASLDPRQHAAMLSVYAFVPEIEVIFFESPGALGNIIGTSPSDEAIREGLMLSKKTLDRLISGRTTYAQLVNHIPLFREEIIKGRQARELLERVDFLVKHHEQFEPAI